MLEKLFGDYQKSRHWSKEQAAAQVDRDGWLIAVLSGACISSVMDDRLQRLAMLVVVMGERLDAVEQALELEKDKQ